MNTSEKIAALESLLVRVQKRAQEPRPARAAHSPAVEAAPASPSFEHIPETPVAESPSTVDFAPPASAAPAVEPAAVPAPTATPIPSPTTAKGVTASYVAKGGMSEELPDFDLEDEDEEVGEEGDEEILVDETAAEPAVEPSEPDEAEELAIPLRPSTQMRAVVAPTPIELPTSSDDLVLENTPLASALPAATEEAIALQARKIPPQSVPAMPAVAASLDELEADVSAAAVTSAPEIKTPAQSQVIDEPEPTLVSQTIDLPLPEEEPKVEAPIPLVQPARAAEPAVELAPAAPVVAAVVEPAPVVAAIVEPVVAAVPPAVEAAPAPAVVAAPAQPVVHEAGALPEADVLAVEHEVVREPASFAKLLRRALALRVK